MASTKTKEYRKAKLPTTPLTPGQRATLGMDTTPLSPDARTAIGNTYQSGPNMGPQPGGQPGQVGKFGLSPEAISMLGRQPPPSQGMGPPNGPSGLNMGLLAQILSPQATQTLRAQPDRGPAPPPTQGPLGLSPQALRTVGGLPSTMMGPPPAAPPKPPAELNILRGTPSPLEGMAPPGPVPETPQAPAPVGPTRHGIDTDRLGGILSPDAINMLRRSGAPPAGPPTLGPMGLSPQAVKATGQMQQPTPVQAPPPRGVSVLPQGGTPPPPAPIPQPPPVQPTPLPPVSPQWSQIPTMGTNLEPPAPPSPSMDIWNTPPPNGQTAPTGGDYLPEELEGLETDPNARPTVDPTLSPTLQAMQREGPVSAEMIDAMTRARARGIGRENDEFAMNVMGARQPKPAAAPAKPAMPATPTFSPAQAPYGGLDPNAKAIIDAISGRGAHLDMSGRRIGGATDPNLRYMIEALFGRHHTGMGGQIIR